MAPHGRNRHHSRAFVASWSSPSSWHASMHLLCWAGAGNASTPAGALDRGRAGAVAGPSSRAAFGGRVCTPRSASCSIVPVAHRSACAAYASFASASTAKRGRRRASTSSTTSALFARRRRRHRRWSVRCINGRSIQLLLGVTSASADSPRRRARCCCQTAVFRNRAIPAITSSALTQWSRRHADLRASGPRRSRTG